VVSNRTKSGFPHVYAQWSRGRIRYRFEKRGYQKVWLRSSDPSTRAFAEEVENVHTRLLLLGRSDSRFHLEGDMAAYMRTILTKARKRAKGARRPFTICMEDVRALYRAQHGRCCLSGIPFSLKESGSATRKPLAPSVDRIDCEQGYTLSNIRLVLLAVNIGLSDFGTDLYRRICKGVASPSPPLLVGDENWGDETL